MPNSGDQESSSQSKSQHGTDPIESSEHEQQTPGSVVETYSYQRSRPMSPKRAKSFDVKLTHSTKSRLNGQGGDMPAMSVKRQHSEPAANKLDVLRKSFYNRTNSVKSSIKKTTADFFGLNSDTKDESKAVWMEKRKRLLNRTLGPLKGEAEEKLSFEGQDTNDGHIQESMDLQSSPEIPFKKPVLKLAFSGIHNVANTLKKSKSGRDKDISLKSIKVRPSFTELPTEEPISGDFFEQGTILGGRLTDSPEPMEGYEQVDSESFLPDFVVDEPGFRSPDVRPIRSIRLAAPERRRSEEESQNWRFLEQPHRIPLSILKNIHDNSDRRMYGMGIVGKLLNRKFRKNLTPEEKKQLNSHLDDYRPYFTYWVTMVQVVILLISLCTYGFGPFGLIKVKISAHVFVTSLSIQQVDYFEPNNIWLGPRAADLIHLGAKYTPCMRKDKLIFEEIDKERNEERNTACCVRNYDRGCVQTTRDRCSPILSTWLKWDLNATEAKNAISIPSIFYYNDYGLPVNHLRASGTVCGQDPRYCQDPVSRFPTEWADDITKWPICKNAIQTRGSVEKHMSCDLIGRPCCIGIHGECKIVTREYCDFVKGFFHEEATLCSQVSCMSDVCGMLQIKRDDNLLQFYRVWTSLFLHAGIIHVAITIIFQYYIMRDIEKLIGAFRVGIIYMFSGIGGNLASAVFVPYRAEVGPGGCQFGLLACLIVEVIHSWKLLENPRKALFKLLLIAAGLFAYGLLPWIDNYAHLFGFLIGFCLSLCLLPFITILGDFKIRLKVVIICVCLLLVFCILVILSLFLYRWPIYDCKYCSYFNCIPFTEDWCADHDMVIKRKDIL